MMKFIFLNATHTVSIYNRNTLTHIEYLYHFTWRHSLDPTSLRYSIADKLLVKFSCRLLHLLLRFQRKAQGKAWAVVPRAPPPSPLLTTPNFVPPLFLPSIIRTVRVYR